MGYIKKNNNQVTSGSGGVSYLRKEKRAIMLYSARDRLVDEKSEVMTD